MQDGESIIGRDEAKRETIGQAHVFHTQTSTEGTYITVTVTIMQRNTRMQSGKETKARNERRSTTE